MLRAAAKNHARVAVLIDPARLRRAASPRCRHGGTHAGAAPRLRRQGLRAHQRLRRPDHRVAVAARGAIRQHAAQRLAQHTCNLSLKLASALRYGENPHQRGAFYVERDAAGAARVATARFLQGKELSYNNLADADAALECVQGLRRAGLRDRQARQSLRRGRGRRPDRRPTTAPTPPTRPRPSAASSPSTARSTPRPPPRSSSASSSRW